MLELTGRSRRYFALSPGELESSGKSVEPKEIAGSPYFTISNASTSYKANIVRRVLTRLAYSEADQAEVTRGVIGGAHGRRVAKGAPMSRMPAWEVFYTVYRDQKGSKDAKGALASTIANWAEDAAAAKLPNPHFRFHLVQRRVLRYFHRHGLLDEADAHGILGTRRRRVGQGFGRFRNDAPSVSTVRTRQV